MMGRLSVYSGERIFASNIPLVDAKILMALSNTFTISQSNIQCCGSGSGIRCLFGPWILDPKSGMGKKSGYGSGIRIRMNNPDHISESLKNNFWVKIFKFRWGSGIRDGKSSYPGSRIQDPG